MAKQVILAHPFERLSGNVTRAKQKLVYAENDNPAWEAPHSRQYARNFKPQMNLRYNASTGKTSFTIQTKSAVDNTEAGRLRLATFGGIQAIKNAIKQNPTLLGLAYEAYAEVKDYFKSFDSFLAREMYHQVKNKNAVINFGIVASPNVFKLNNPWVAGGSASHSVTLSAEILQKFATYLCPAVVTIDGKVVAGSPSAGMNFSGSGAWVGTAFNNGDFTCESDSDPVYYKGAVIYTSTGSEVMGDDVAAGTYYTTAPNA